MSARTAPSTAVSTPPPTSPSAPQSAPAPAPALTPEPVLVSGLAPAPARSLLRERTIPRLVTQESGLVARVGPQQYTFRRGALDDLVRILDEGGYRSLALVHGEVGLGKARPFLPDLEKSGIEVLDIPFGGECTLAESERIADLLVKGDLHAVLAVGGGKVLDTAKAAALRAGDLPLILVPTLASNCAPWACLSVMYEADGTPIGHEIHPTQAKALLVEPRILLDSPLETLRAGIGDTLAKWYECVGGLEAAPASDLCVGLAAHTARQCRDVLLGDGAQALADMDAGTDSEQWRRVVQVVIMTAGLVGSFGGSFGRATGAHAVHDGISVLASQAQTPHGTKVAYGTLVQLSLEGRWEEVDDLDAVHDALGLPCTLGDLGVTEDPSEAVRTIAHVATLAGKTIHNLPFPVTARDVERAIEALEDHESARRRDHMRTPIHTGGHTNG